MWRYNQLLQEDKVNTRSSPETELVLVDAYMPEVFLVSIIYPRTGIWGKVCINTSG